MSPLHRRLDSFSSLKSQSKLRSLELSLCSIRSLRSSAGSGVFIIQSHQREVAAEQRWDQIGSIFAHLPRQAPKKGFSSPSNKCILKKHSNSYFHAYLMITICPLSIGRQTRLKAPFLRAKLASTPIRAANRIHGGLTHGTCPHTPTYYNISYYTILPYYTLGIHGYTVYHISTLPSKETSCIIW